MKKTRYICIEGTEGVYKTTNTKALVEYLKSQGYSVLETKEPGSPHAPLTVHLRGLMLDNQYDSQLTMASREFISQAIRSIHLEKVILPAMGQYDFIVQDRGVLSGFAYGAGCGNSEDYLHGLASYVLKTSGLKIDNPRYLYSDVIYLTTSDPFKSLKTAVNSKQEFETGDAMESRGNSFLSNVSDNMKRMSTYFNAKEVNVDNKDRDQILSDILKALKL
jgi:thymidylate kinase